MTFDPTKIALNIPNYQTDKVLGVYSGSLSVAAPTIGQTVLYTESAPIVTGFGDSVLTQAIYSTDGGVTWNDDNMTKPNTSTATLVSQTLDVTSFSGVNTVGIATANWYSATLGGGTAYTIQYKIFAFAKSNQGILTPSTTNYALSYSSADNYLKIVAGLDGISPQSLGIGGSITYSSPHSLGYVPTSRAYIEYTNGRIWPATRNQYPATGLGTSNNPVQTSIRPDSTKTDYVMVNTGAAVSFNLHYRTYLDE